MAYNPTIWVDNQTPVDARNMNKAETGIKQQETDITTLSEYVVNMDERVTTDIQVLSDFVVDMSSEDIGYVTEADTSILSVKDALDKLLYVPLSITSFGVSKSVGERGEVITNPVLTWNYNKNPKEQKVNNVVVENTLRRLVVEGNYNLYTTFSLAANDGKTNVSRNVAINFYNGRYHGVSSATTYDSAFVKTLTKVLTESRGTTFTVNCGVGQHIFFCIPSRFGTPTFTVGGFSGGFAKVDTIQFVNNFNYVESYDIWKSTNSNLGNTTVVVG